ncbi:Oidioi.mRNA.OKI2018_I69.chr1.g893.t1.cds [Oikopleura dioica]|uniref:Oidioi.mRNA.OKI2018_I69.chr1.g893.t1.cds n=1 Tax=Oikopleura dioica TaxID=34765 RepID=A0ABN7SQK9_OIKDI|nr:Oidioi.mRNA.OKI2018_I69.chr1.g893.t1.cds [Oikopleura dioica]
MADKKSAKKGNEEDKPVTMDGLKGQLLRFGEHNILSLRKELHAAVDEEARFSDPSQKDIRKQLMDKVLMAVLMITKLEDQVNDHKKHVVDLNKKSKDLKLTFNVHKENVEELEAHKRQCNQKISNLRAEKKSLEEYAQMQKTETDKMNAEMAPYKKQNAMLMNIVSAAEKGHNMLLTTMSSINKEISSGL